MVGTTRFELATSPTPRVRSTRLSHVPTMVAHRPGRGDGWGFYMFKCTRCLLPRRHRVGILAERTKQKEGVMRSRKTGVWTVFVATVLSVWMLPSGSAQQKV